MAIHPHLEIKQKLTRFWKEFGNYEYGRWRKPAFVRLELLKRYASIKINYKSRLPLSKHRHKFNQEKWTLLPLGDFGRCFVCTRPAHIRHHIIQLQNGGINSKLNLLSLCNDCHAEIHPHLKQISSGVGKDQSLRSSRKGALDMPAVRPEMDRVESDLVQGDKDPL